MFDDLVQVTVARVDVDRSIGGFPPDAVSAPAAVACLIPGRSFLYDFVERR